MTAHEVDVVVIGLGPGGEDVAGRLAEAGLRVVGVERELVGGECPYWGCVPSKMMIRAANSLAEARRVGLLAGDADVRPDFADVAARIRAEATDDWNDQVAVDRFTGKGGVFVRGTARLEAADRVRVGDHTYEAARGVVVATGSRASIPPIEGLAGTPYWTSREAVAATEAPESMIVLGGGAIGVELAQAFGRFGTRVDIVEADDRILAFEEPEASALVTDVLTREGLGVHIGASVTAVAHDGQGFRIRAGDKELSAQQLLVATGRRPDLSTLGVDTIGLDPQAHAVPVDEHMRVHPGVWAVGDVTGVGAFTHVAMYQAGIAVADILGQDAPGADYRALPRVTFTDPEVGSVGLTEQQARKAGLTVTTGISQVPSSARGWIHKAGNDGVIKLVADGEVLVGATSAGPVGGEVLSMLTLAVAARVPIQQLRRMIYAYPTFHRGVEDALRDLAG